MNFQGESDKPGFGWCSKREWYISTHLAETQAVCDGVDTRVSPSRKKPNTKRDERLTSIQLKIKCSKCGTEMLPRASGAHLFQTVAFLCPKCLHEAKLKKPIFHPPDLNRQFQKPPPEALEEFKNRIRQIR